MHKDVKEFLIKRLDEKAHLLIEMAYDRYEFNDDGTPAIEQTKSDLLLNWIDWNANKFQNTIGNIAYDALFTDFDLIGEVIKRWDDRRFPMDFSRHCIRITENR